MIEAVLAFAAGWLLTWPALIALLFFGIIAEHNSSRGWAIFFGLAAAVVAYFFFNVSLMTIAIGSVAYIVIGLLWSFYRYRRHVKTTVAESKNLSDMEKHRVVAKLHPNAMLGTITSWVFIWPFSMVENIVGDIIDVVQTLITKVFRGLYHKVYEAAVAELKV